MERILRLLVTEILTDDWPVKKRGDFGAKDIPVIESFDYDKVVICGGEPLLFKRNIERLAQTIAVIGDATGKRARVYIETSCCNYLKIDAIRKYINGIVLMPKTKSDMQYFKQLNNEILKNCYFYEKKELRLLVIPSVSYFLPENLRMWQVTEFEDDNIPVSSEGCDYRRLNRLWENDEGWYDFERTLYG